MKKYSNSALVILIILFVMHVTFNLALFNNKISENVNIRISSDITSVPFEVGVEEGPQDLDPQNAWDSASFNVIDQVCEGLFTYDLSDPELNIIPHLASDYGVWDPNNTEYTVSLRQGVLFHDGTPFNADAVNFTWERMSWALNSTGTNFDTITKVYHLYEFQDGTPIVNRVRNNNDYNFTFVLNRPYAAFEALLCFEGSYFVSPTSTNATEYIDTTTGDLVGTGPFVYDSYISGYEITFHAFNNYWKGSANIKNLVFSIISNANTRNEALLNGNIHFLPNPMFSMLNTFKANPSLRVADYGLTSATIQYLGMNTVQINRTYREAISYAVNYSHIVNMITEGSTERLNSPIPMGIKYANDTYNTPIFNITHARMIMQSMGFGAAWDPTYPGTNEFNWENATFISYNYTYNIGNVLKEDIFQLLQSDLDIVGIQLIDAEVSWSDFIDKLYELGGHHRNELQLYVIAWIPDFNDPSSIINNFFTNTSIAKNGVQYDGYYEAQQAGRNPLILWDNVQLLLEEALVETDPLLRENMYHRIQELLIEDMPFAWLYTPKIYHAYHQNLIGFQQNALYKLDFYSCSWLSSPIVVGPFEFLFYLVLALFAVYIVVTSRFINLNKIRIKRRYKNKQKLLKTKTISDEKLFDIYRTYLQRAEDFSTNFEHASKILKIDKNELISVKICPLEYQNQMIDVKGLSQEGLSNANIYRDEYKDLRNYIEYEKNINIETFAKTNPTNKDNDVLLCNFPEFKTVKPDFKAVIIESDSGLEFTFGQFFIIFIIDHFEDIFGDFIDGMIEIIEKNIKKFQRGYIRERDNIPSYFSVLLKCYNEDLNLITELLDIKGRKEEFDFRKIKEGIAKITSFFKSKS